MSQVLELRSGDVSETWEIGRRIANVLEPPVCIGLVGPLGAGKTNLVKGLAQGWGVTDGRSVNSPTFVLVNEYVGRVPVYHLDAYRLTSAGELRDLGFDEMVESDGVVIVEWADRVRAALPGRTLWIDAQICGDRDRRFVMRTNDAALAEKLANLRTPG